jgi:hypothetical protein
MRILRYILICVGIIAGLWLVLFFTSVNRRQRRFLIPQGYIGFIQVQFGVKDAPPLALEDGRYLLKIPPSGLLTTSNDWAEGWGDPDQYYYYSGEKRVKLTDGFDESLLGKKPVNQMIWGGQLWPGNGYPTTYMFYLGPESKFDKVTLPSQAKPPPRVAPEVDRK